MTLLPKAGSNHTIFGNSFLIFLIRFFPSLATLVVVILFSRHISEEAYGNYQNFWVQLLLLSAVATMGIPAFLLTYSAGFVKQLLVSLRPKHLSGVLLWMLAITLVFVMVRQYTAATTWYIPFSFFLLYCLNAVTESMLIVFRRFGWLLCVNVLYAAVFIWLHLGVLNGTYDIDTLFVLLLLPGVLKLLVTTIVTGESVKRTEAVADDDYTRADIRSLWLHIGIYDVLQRVFSWVDKFAISLLFAASVSAVYFNGTFDVPFLPLLLGAVSSAALLQMASLPNKADNASAVLIANQTARMLSAVVFPIFFFLFLFRYELFSILLTDKYIDSVPIFAVTVCIVPLRAYNFTSILQNRHKGRVINIGAVMDLVIACALMYPLYLWMGLTGIAASFVISSYIQGAYYLYHTSKVLGTPMLQLVPVTNWIIKLIVFALVFISIHYLLNILFAPPFVLLLGIIVLVLALLVSVAIEFRASKKGYGQPFSQK